MRFLLGWFGFSLLFTNVLANAWSAPYQAILIWYAYRMDVKVYGAGNTYVATACVGSLEDGSCSFDELLKYIQKSGNWAMWTGSTSVGDTLNPDVLELGTELKEMNAANTGSAKYTYKEDWYKIIPSKFFPGYAAPSFYTAYGQLVNIIQVIRQEAPGLGKNIDDELDGARRAMVLADDGRQYDDSSYLIKALNNKLASGGVSWEVTTKTVEGPEGYTWEQADVEATLAAHPEASEDLKSAVRKLGSEWGAEFSEDTGSTKHAEALFASTLFQSTLLDDSTCELEL